ncbi:G1 family glutamic endopeptidase [Jatrophihabitans sp. GAS493]|uniref:G1 family glutamic endopeptidase n=1 Tax=Jatrophihabitans sp. GAS493 TaxID=1907575 RepID=UPI000BB8C758|nr:G1 family glutamic endopeptidase [Jatrophihabitans sp. GAS493]
MSIYSGGWSGFVARGGSYSSAAADFIVPVGVCSPAQSQGIADAYWVGIQGDNGGPAAIVQTGFALGCVNGQAVYYALHADLQGNWIYLPEHVQPGDLIDASVSCDATGLCGESLVDETQGWSDTSALQAQVGYAGYLAAVAAESYNGGVNDFPAQVSNAIFNGAPIAQFGPQANEETPSAYGGTAGLDPSPLDSTGMGFYFYWNGVPGLLPGASPIQYSAPRSGGLPPS